jgi:parvulin-like peptidyl-prolyl isomerase
LKGFRLLREPLVYFLAVGAALFALTQWLGTDGGRRIVVTDSERQRLFAQWQAQMGRPPTDTELAALVEQWIREEIYYREAVAMGLDEDDVIIRRRLAQKLTFLTEDLATAEPPEDAALRAYYQTHVEQYTEPERWTFSHRYYSGERRDQAQADAAAALGNLADGDAPTGDPFMLQQDYVGRSQREIGELFGREFAAALADVPVGGWQGPIRSAYGWHLVNMTQRQAPRQLTFEEVVERVAVDYRQQQRRDANEAYYQALLSRYDIVRS